MPPPVFGLFNPERLAPAVHDELTQLTAALQTAFQQIGRSIDVPFFAGDFTASGSMTWTVAAAQAITFAYALIGKRMFVEWVVVGGTVGGTVGSALRIKIPAGQIARRTVLNSVEVTDAGVRGAGDASVAANGTVISISRRDSGNFTAGAVDTSGQISFEVV